MRASQVARGHREGPMLSLGGGPGLASPGGSIQAELEEKELGGSWEERIIGVAQAEGSDGETGWKALTMGVGGGG